MLLKSTPVKMSRYVEPFAGSACLFLALQPQQALLSDINRELIETYDALSLVPEDVASALSEMPQSADFYYLLRSRDPNSLDLTGRAARFIYLNRFCFNGVYRTNRAGQFNVPYGSRTGKLPCTQHFVAVGCALRRAARYTCDFECTLGSVRDGDFVYLDPPYHKRPKGGYGEYGYNSFEIRDLPRFCGAVHRAAARGATILISYSDTLEVSEWFPNWFAKRLTVRRHVSGFSDSRGCVDELLISNKRFDW